MNKNSPNKKTAVVLFNLGGPDKLDSVKPFLFNLFNDKAIINLPQPFRFFLAKLISWRRAPKAQKIYSKIGGRSPLLDITVNQAHELERELSFFGEYKTFVVMRYWHPFAYETIKQIIEYKPSEIVLLPLYPQFSSATTASSFDDFLLKLPKNLKENVTVKTVCCYPKEEDFIKSHALLIEQTISKFCEKKLSEFRFLFSAHGLPQKIIDSGDPYVWQVEATTQNIILELANILKISPNEINSAIDWQVCYQSKVGPLKWTSPSLDHEIQRVALDKKTPVIIPIAFVSDHSETLVELDIDYKELSESLGIENYLRVPSLNIDKHFIKSLVEICKNVSTNYDDTIFSGKKAERICPKSFKLCRNNNHCEA